MAGDNGRITWTNERRKLGELIPWPINPRQIKKDEAERLGNSLAIFGQVQTLAISPSNEIYDGHQRKFVWSASEKFGADYVVDVRVSNRELTEPERKQLSIYLGKGTLGDFDFDGLANNFEVDDLLDWGFDAKELDLDLWNDEPVDDPGAQIDRAEELREKWGVKRGDLWQIGNHRIICGDCTDPLIVAVLMEDVKISLVWTDPPYGVKYGDKLEAANPMGYRVRTIENDDLPEDELEEFIRSAFAIAAEFSDPGAAIYAACPPGTPLPTAIAAFVGSGFEFRWQLVWVKDQLVLSRADYHFRHENILYGWKPDGAHYFTADRKQDSVFEIPRPKVSDEHPTMKPIELVEAMIGNSSKSGDAVYDPFLGSGTTLVACERLNRIGRGVEISPAYCAVAIQRLVDMGLEAELV